ncbi:hypothetical protein [Imhoffiella purpurea]|uniref:Uncharacterized protein n=1 Tax=Imhoffiella purpurea TaxID=1249627 RepID=W9VFS5_9GAMM|nr:hypothetical protein [Imhoffiella purpurea]EXJ15836.1 hypothetical protein D779_1060 [Imhoffiella purpurea]
MTTSLIGSGMPDRLSWGLRWRTRPLAKRYERPLPHLKTMGRAWN